MRKTRKCAFCGKEFTCNSGSQRYCSEHCAEAAKAQRKKRQQDFLKALQPVIDIASQEYLTFSKAAILMGCSRQYVYKLVNEGKLSASRISSRMAFIRKADIEKVLAGNPYHRVLPTYKPMTSSSLSLKKRQASSKLEKARVFAPFGHAGLPPFGMIRLTPPGKIKMTPVDDTAGEFFCSFENPCPGTAGFNIKNYKYDCKIKKHPEMLRSWNGNKRDGQYVSHFPQHSAQVCPAVHFKRQADRATA